MRLRSDGLDFFGCKLGKFARFANTIQHITGASIPAQVGWIAAKRLTTAMCNFMCVRWLWAISSFAHKLMRLSEPLINLQYAVTITALCKRKKQAILALVSNCGFDKSERFSGACSAIFVGV